MDLSPPVTLDEVKARYVVGQTVPSRRQRRRPRRRRTQKLINDAYTTLKRPWLRRPGDTLGRPVSTALIKDWTDPMAQAHEYERKPGNTWINRTPR